MRLYGLCGHVEKSTSGILPYTLRSAFLFAVKGIATMANAPFNAPDGYRWVFTPFFWNVRAKRYLYASDYGRKARCILVRVRK
jgi:hypothetical protein